MQGANVKAYDWLQVALRTMGRLLAVAFLVFLCGSPSGALLTRKRSTLEANDENRLIEALKVRAMPWY